MIAMTYGSIYVARVSMGANPTQTVRAFVEAESYDGPSLIIANSHCQLHGINMTEGMNYQKMSVDSGAWVLFRYDPRKSAQGENPLIARLQRADAAARRVHVLGEPVPAAAARRTRSVRRCCSKRPRRTWPSASRCTSSGRRWTRFYGYVKCSRPVSRMASRGGSFLSDCTSCRPPSMFTWGQRDVNHRNF